MTVRSVSSCNALRRLTIIYSFVADSLFGMICSDRRVLIFCYFWSINYNREWSSCLILKDCNDHSLHLVTCLTSAHVFGWWHNCYQNGWKLHAPTLCFYMLNISIYCTSSSQFCFASSVPHDTTKFLKLMIWVFTSSHFLGLGDIGYQCHHQITLEIFTDFTAFVGLGYRVQYDPPKGPEIRSIKYSPKDFQDGSRKCPFPFVLNKWIHMDLLIRI